MLRITSLSLLCALLIGCSDSKPSPSNEPTTAPADKGPGIVRESERVNAEGPLALEALPPPPEGRSFREGIAACSRTVGSIDVFAASTDGALWMLTFDGSWQSWQPIGEPGTADTGVSVSTRGARSKTVDLFYRDAASQQLGHRYLLADTSEWQSELVGSSTILPFVPAAAGDAADRIDVFAKGVNSTLIHISKDEDWSVDWATVSDVDDVRSPPTVTASGDGRLDVFWARQDPEGLRHWWFDGAEHAPSATIGDAIVSAPASTSRSSGLLDVMYVLGTTPSTVVHRYYDAGWRSQDFELPDAASLAVSSWGSGRIDVFALDAAGIIRHGVVPGRAMLTQHNDVARTGSNDHEIDLNVENVASADFGQLFTLHVDGNVWAQPLYQPTLDLSAQGQGIRNGLYVATANDSVYLFDADTGEELVKTSLGNPVPVPFADFTTGNGNPASGNVCNYNSLPQVGITSTPVVDPDTNTLYVTALTADEPLPAETIGVCSPVVTPTHVYRIQLHALDGNTLQERDGSPVTVAPTYWYANQKLPFAANRQMQRPALLLSQGRVYLAFGSYTDRKPFYGWVVSYDAATLKQQDVFVSTPEGVTFSNGGNGGIWQSGQGLAASPNGDVYFFTGNGVGYKNSPWANAAVELAADLSMVSVFRPYNAGSLDLLDLDLSCSGAMLVPETNFVLGGGKEGRLYVLNQGNLGTASKTADDVVSEDFIVTPAPECVLQTGDAESNLHGAPVYWKSDSGAANLYLMGEGDFLHKLEIDPKVGKLTVRARSKERAACGMPGGFLSVSSNGDNPQTAIVWANVPAGDALAGIVPATFYAYNAETLETLYRDDSRSLPGSADQFAKFVPPTVANGRVYQAAFAPAARESGSLNANYAGSVVVYGLKSKLAYK